MLVAKALQQTKIDQVEIEIFLSHLLRKDRAFIKAFPETTLNENHVVSLKEFVKRRTQREPLAYILGYKEFCGFKFRIDQRAMVPRPETEELIREVISHVYAMPNRNRDNHWKYDSLKIVDVGTGSGNIAITLAKSTPFAEIFAIEKDPAAYELAKENIALHSATNQIELILGDLLQPLNAPVDIIVANLPYIPRPRFASLSPEVSKWEPRIALDGGDDGLLLYRRLFSQAPKALKKNGILFYELDGQTNTKRFNSGGPLWL